MRRIVLILLTLAVCSLAVFAAQADEAEWMEGLQITLSTAGGGVEILPTVINGEGWLFLPGFADAGNTLFTLDGQALRIEAEDDWEEYTEEEHVQIWYLYSGEEELDSLNVMHSENLRAFFLFSDDPELHGREYVEDCEKHEHEATGSMAMIGTDGQVDHAGQLKQIRGRGNGTWSCDKRAYQVKLTERADLLDTSIASEASRTWVLLAEAMDGSYLHNRLALDLALEMGMEETSRSEFVDLYYDGEYRGLYLLAEKVEIASGRVDELDYDELIETWNAQIGQYDLESLPVVQAVNSNGDVYTYIEGVADNDNLGAGAYMIEMESDRTTSERCWFKLDDTRSYDVKSPENASQRMMEYISEKLASALLTLQSGGINPETGRSIAEEFDLASFAQCLLIGEFANNRDSFSYSSSWFILPAGSDQFRAGPVWDYDLGFHYMADGRNLDAQGLKKYEQDWIQYFYSDETFVACMRHVWQEQMAPLISEILLGSSEGQHLKSLEVYADMIEPSARMDQKIWKTKKLSDYVYGVTLEKEWELLERFIRQRYEWFAQTLCSEWTAGPIQLSFSSYFGCEDTKTFVSPLMWLPVEVEYQSEWFSEATEEAYASYRVDAYMEKEIWSAFEDPTPVVNGIKLSYEILPDGRMHFAFLFDDLTYRPVDYYGEDVGMIYNYDYYIQNHPEVLEYCGEDPQAIMDYFFDEGMFEGHKGNAYFDPRRVLETSQYLGDVFGEDWYWYYWDYLTYGIEDGWLDRLNESFHPPIEDAL